jgi:hypothetical protein
LQVGQHVPYVCVVAQTRAAHHGVRYPGRKQGPLQRLQARRHSRQHRDADRSGWSGGGCRRRRWDRGNACRKTDVGWGEAVGRGGGGGDNAGHLTRVNAAENTRTHTQGQLCMPLHASPCGPFTRVHRPGVHRRGAHFQIPPSIPANTAQTRRRARRAPHIPAPGPGPPAAAEAAVPYSTPTSRATNSASEASLANTQHCTRGCGPEAAVQRVRVPREGPTAAMTALATASTAGVLR